MTDYAILTDSGTDTPAEAVLNNPVYIAPLQVEYSDGTTYLDRVNITPDDVARRLEFEIPTTSLPSLESLRALIEGIRADGYHKVIIITISSKLSGTHDAIRLVSQGFSDMEFKFVDTKNIGLGAGMLCDLATKGIKQGLSFEECAQMVQKHVGSTKIFFCVPTLEYLVKGGRIGKVASLVGSALHLVPVITCNDEGIYTPVAKARNWNKALNLAAEKALQFLGNKTNYALFIAQSMASADAEKTMHAFLEKVLIKPGRIVQGDVSPSLTVHAGPKLVGIGVQYTV